MDHFFLSGAYISDAVRLLIVCACLALAVALVLRVLRLIFPDKQSDGGNRGCFVTIVTLGFLVYIFMLTMDAEDQMSRGVPPVLRMLHPSLKGSSNIMVEYTSQTNPRLGDSYETLSRLYAANQRRVREMEQERDFMSTDGGKKQFNKAIEAKKEEAKRIEKMMRQTEFAAGSYYFASMLRYLGEKVDSRSLDQYIEELVTLNTKTIEQKSDKD